MIIISKNNFNQCYFTVSKVVFCSGIILYFIPEKNIENYLLFNIENRIIMHWNSKPTLWIIYQISEVVKKIIVVHFYLCTCVVPTIFD